MKPIVIESSFPKIFGYAGMVIYPFVIVDDVNNKRLMNHEMIHVAQIKEMGYIMFHLFYLMFYVKGLIKFKSHHKAYMSIPFEKEAYAHEYERYYLKERKFGAWASYLTKY